MGAGDHSASATPTVFVETPPDFAFSEVLGYLGRSTEECLYQVCGGRVLRWVQLRGASVLLEIGDTGAGGLDVAVSGPQAETVLEEAAAYVREWFDLDRDVSGFYALAQTDPLLDPVVRAHYGLRLVAVPDLFEALSWAVIGQQINLGLAYTLKRRFVESFGTRQPFGARHYWQFPAPEQIAGLSVRDLRDLQLTQRKSEYLIGIARSMAAGHLSRQFLMGLDPVAAHQALRQIRGVGEWTASYVAMRCLSDMTSFPVGDVGLQNAVKGQLGLQAKPTPDQLRTLGQHWTGWEAYATFYLWRSLAGYSA